MRRVFLTISTLLFACQTQVAYADPKFDEVCDPGKVTPGSPGRVNPRKLIGYLLKTHGVHDVDLDPQGGDIGRDQKISAIIDVERYCSDPRRCSKDAPKRLGEARTELVFFVTRNARRLPTGQNGFEVRPSAPRDAPGLTAFLKGQPGSAQVSCVAAVEQPEEPVLSTAQKQAVDFASRWRIRKKVDDLVIDRSDAKRFKALDRASISFNDDYVKATRMLSTEGVIGIPFTDEYSFLIPFVSHKSQSVAGNNPKNLPNIGNIGVGLLGDFVFPVLSYYQEVQAYVHEIHSYVTDSDIITGTLVWTPDLPLPGVGAQQPVLGLPLWFGLKLQGKLTYGHVITLGTNPALVASNEYGRVGARAEVSLFGDGEILKYFSMVTSYEYLRVFSGPFEYIARFENTLNITFPDQQYWSFQIKYVNGRDLDTLDRQKQLTAGLGLKY